jgi:7-cyano-7-deazaguanosine (preQ0) biosynthesis protein QueE
MMTAEEICTKLMSLSHIRHVTISGGNPALFVDYELFETLHQYYYSATLETQGNIRIPHMALKHIAFKYLVISPKPPSSGMHKRMNSESVAHMINVRKDFGLATYLKYVIFNDEDLTWAEEFDKSLHTNPTERCLSVGTTRNDLEHKDLVEHILACTDGLVDRVLKGQVHYFSNARILPQLHALIWGRQRGV